MVGGLVMVYEIVRDLKNLIEFYTGLLMDYDTAKNVAIEDLREAFDRLPNHVSIKLLKDLKEAGELL